MIKRFSRIAAAALLAAGTIAPAAEAQQPARSLLYRVEGATGTTVYMLGSIHLLSADMYPLPQPVEAAYADAERVFFEIPLDSMQAAQRLMLARAMYPEGKSLRTELPADLFAQVEQLAAANGIPIGMMERMEPWMAGLMFAALEWQKAGLEPEHGVDNHFNQRARTDGKPTGAFETVEFQLGLFDEAPPAEQVNHLRSTLKDLPRMGQTMGDVVAAWRSGDAAAIDSIMNESMEEYPGVFQRMLVDRNAAWIPQIEALLRGRDDVLVVVGAAHLVGEHGVVSMLRQRGYTVEQL